MSKSKVEVIKNVLALLRFKGLRVKNFSLDALCYLLFYKI